MDDETVIFIFALILAAVGFFAIGTGIGHVIH